MATIARASTLPAGSIPPSESLSDGEVQIKIVSVRENNELSVEYPGGFVRDHQARGIEELIPKIVNNLRARYGVEAALVVTAPPIAEGATIIMEVSNGS